MTFTLKKELFCVIYRILHVKQLDNSLREHLLKINTSGKVA